MSAEGGRILRLQTDKLSMESIVPAEVIERRILLIRKQKVMLDSDLAELYGVTTGHHCPVKESEGVRKV